jgi:TonB family protein
MHKTIAALAALALTAASPLHAEPRVLAPYGPWNVDFGEDSCRLQRLFGTAEDKHALVFQQYWPSNGAGLTLAGSAVAKFQDGEYTDLKFLEGQRPMAQTALTGTLGDVGRAVIFTTVHLDRPLSPPNREDTPEDRRFAQMDTSLGKQVRFVEVGQGGRKVRFETGPLDSAFEVLNQCTLELLRDLGLDAERHVSMQSGPRWINQAALTRKIVSSYPREALAQGEQGIMQMRVIVSAEGAVESCTILKSTTTVRLESPACDVMQRAKFEPAIDAEGKPFRALYATSITYKGL